MGHTAAVFLCLVWVAWLGYKKRMINFVKMHGLGNDFILLDARQAKAHAPLNILAPILTQAELPKDFVIGLAHRRLGLGCDQLLVISAPTLAGADIAVRFYNPDGSEAGACGNGTRCLAALEMQRQNTTQLNIQTAAGLLRAQQDKTGNKGGGLVHVCMGAPKLNWQDIPLSGAADAQNLPIKWGRVRDGVAVSMGNPHLVFFVEDVASIDVARHGPELEHHPLFPARTNVEFVQILSPQKLRMRVWERGTGITPACASGACAALVAGVLHGRAERTAELILDGGSLHIEWRQDSNEVWQAGATSLVAEGVLSANFVAQFLPGFGAESAHYKGAESAPCSSGAESAP